MPGRWVHLVTAPDQFTAEFWLQVLQDAGITAIIRPSDAVSFLGVSGYGCRLRVREEDLAAAREIIPEAADEAET
jgi:hypothetical protein